MDFTTAEKTSIKFQATIDAIKKANPNRTLTSEEITHIIKQSSEAAKNIDDLDAELDQPLSPTVTDLVSISTSSRGTHTDNTAEIAGDDRLPVGTSDTNKRANTPYPRGTASTQFRRAHIKLDPSVAQDRGLSSSPAGAGTSALERLARIAQDRGTPGLFAAFTAVDPPVVTFDDTTYTFSEFMKLPPLSVVTALLRLDRAYS
jgi:hypothetical protein